MHNVLPEALARDDDKVAVSVDLHTRHGGLGRAATLPAKGLVAPLAKGAEEAARVIEHVLAAHLGNDAAVCGGLGAALGRLQAVLGGEHLRLAAAAQHGLNVAHVGCIEEALAVLGLAHVHEGRRGALGQHGVARHSVGRVLHVRINGHEGVVERCARARDARGRRERLRRAGLHDPERVAQVLGHAVAHIVCKEGAEGASSRR